MFNPSLLYILQNMASAVKGMTVAEVRKALGCIRHMWSVSSGNQPLFICNTLANGERIADFCTEFEYGHHLKRHYKSSQGTRLTSSSSLASPIHYAEDEDEDTKTEQDYDEDEEEEEDEEDDDVGEEEEE
jgi:hypothetical protein